jgi:(4S)-4-hydroxy-5-phosphonooxypentane-2,3-dione isomerase
MSLAVVVEFRVVPERHDMFRRLILENAAASLRHEPGWGSRGRGARPFCAHEIYADAEAFDQHLRSNHYLLFDTTASPFVTEKKVMRLTMVEPESLGAHATTRE